MLKQAVILSSITLASLVSAIEIYIAPNGSDSNNGSSSRPVKTFAKAQQLVSQSKDSQKVVIVKDGEYILNSGILLDSKSNGTVYRAENKGNVRLIGGQYVPANKFTKVTDKNIYERLPKNVRDKVVELDLAALNIKHTGPMADLFGNLGQVGNGGIVDLYFEGKRQELSRWPNVGYTTMKEVLVNGENRGEPGKFRYREDRPANWLKAVENGDLYLKGFWRVPWTCQNIRIKEINPKEKSMTHAVGMSLGIGSKYVKEENGLRKGDGKELYLAFNLPEELDIPGEWYINSKTKKLYIYPPSKINDHSVLISDLASPVLKVKGANNILIENLIFAAGLVENISIESSNNITIAGCTIHSTGGIAIKVQGGNSTTIQSCDIFNIGAEAINMNSGDRKTLTSSNNKIINNKIYKFGEVVKISNSMNLDGVGIYIAHNEIFEGNYCGIRYTGNNHIFEYNELYHLGLDGGDYGVFYTHADWSSAGSIIRYNFGHHAVGGHFFYPDDGKSNDKAINNVAYSMATGLFAGGGHNNQFLDNVMYNVTTGIHIDDRGVSRKYDRNSAFQIRNYSKYDVKNNPAYLKQYPGIENIFDHNPTNPTGNVATGNFVVNYKVDVALKGNKNHFTEVTVKDNVFSQKNIGFKNPEKLDFTVPNSKIYNGKLAWLNSEFPKIGLYKDQYRTQLVDNKERYEQKKVVREFDSVKDMEASNRIEKKD